MRRWVLVGMVLMAGGCECSFGPKVTLVVNLLTEIQPGFEFDEVRVDVDGAQETYAVQLGDRFTEPLPVAELEVSPGTRTIVLQLYDHGAFVAEGALITPIRSAASRVVHVQAACRRVRCPSGTYCRDGECAVGGSVDCPGELEVCPTECATAADCPASSDGCSDAVCTAGACVGEPREAACPGGYFCSVDVGCILTPPDLDGGVDDGAVEDAGLDAGPPLEVPEPCATCTTNCGTDGEELCLGGVGTGVCIAEEVLNLEDDDCDGIIDEGFGTDRHRHAIVCELGGQLVDQVLGMPGGGICGGGGCGAALADCRTLRDGSDGHWHEVSPRGLAIPGDAWFACPERTDTVNGHRHDVRCAAGPPSLIADTFYHEIDPRAPAHRYNHFCIPPGRLEGECRLSWGPMTAY